jgi:hypothetical protein
VDNKYRKVRRVVFFIGFILIALPASSIDAQSGIPEIKFEGQSISVEIEGATLETIFDKINETKSIWFKGTISALQERITASFVDLPIEYGLKIILSNLNYSLIFDNNQRVLGVVVLGKNIKSESIPEGYRKTLAMAEIPENDFNVNSQENAYHDEDYEESPNNSGEQPSTVNGDQKTANTQTDNEEENSADTELPYLPHDYQYE